jgi:NADH-quinone oxidoreductase subunit L
MASILSFLILFFPLSGFLINGLLGKKLGKGLSGIIASVSILASFICTLVIFLTKGHSASEVTLFSWIHTHSAHIDFSLRLDPLSIWYTLFITGIGFLIHVYSTAYMHDDEGFQRFFTYLNLFVFFMLILVLGNNFLLMFVGWEGVGLCSYLLIGFWYKNSSYNDAARKAFVMNRIGDFGFILGIILIYITYGSLNYADVFDKAGIAGTSIITTICFLLFIGAMGKSAQIPLYTWLPDAMAGPTPVSALIHAATMVTAGIYMIARSHVFYVLSESASLFVAWIGAATALLGALIGTAQNDIKKVLAYSTVSQLGLMFVGLGAGAYTSSVFHVTTHAFFKALLFLGAGSVIHAMGGEQDIRKMGGLKPHLKITYLTMLLATLAISGVPPFSGFFSKDEILAHVYEYNTPLWAVSTLASFLTAFYMFRMFILVFFGNFRGTEHQRKHLHESPTAMTVPLIILAVLSVFGGMLGLPPVFHAPHWLHGYLHDSLTREPISLLSHETEWMLMGLAVAVAGLGIYLAWTMYFKNKTIPPVDDAKRPWYEKWAYAKFYVDELYTTLFQKPLDALSLFFKNFFQKYIFDGVVGMFGGLVQLTGNAVRLMQHGNISFYLIGMAAGLIVILYFLVKL